MGALKNEDLDDDLRRFSLEDDLNRIPCQKGLLHQHDDGNGMIILIHSVLYRHMA